MPKVFFRERVYTRISLRRKELFYNIDEFRLFYTHWQDASVHDQPGFVDQLEQKPIQAEDYTAFSILQMMLNFLRA
jgi:hypothetical protein